MKNSLTRIARACHEDWADFDSVKTLMAATCGAILLVAMSGGGSAWAGTVYTEVINDTETNSVTSNYGGGLGAFADMTGINLGAPLGAGSLAYEFLVLGYETPVSNQVQAVQSCNFLGCTTQYVTYSVPGVHVVQGAGIEIYQEGDLLGELTDVPGLPKASELFSGTGYLPICEVNADYCPGTGNCDGKTAQADGCGTYSDGLATTLDFPQFSGTKYLHLKFLVGSDYYLGTATLIGTGSSLTLSEIQYTAASPDLTPSAAPEPGTWALAIMGFGLAGAALRRRRETAVS